MNSIITHKQPSAYKNPVSREVVLILGNLVFQKFQPKFPEDYDDINMIKHKVSSQNEF